MRKNKTYLRIMSLILVFLITLSTVAVAVTIISWPDELMGFEEYNPVYTEYVYLGTAIEDTSLPESVRGVVDIPDDMDVGTFTQVEPTVDSSTGTDYYDYYDYGYVQASDSAEKYAAGEIVIYTIFYTDSDEIGYRVYGYLDGSTTVWFTCDIDGNITGAVLDIPVEWTGDYDSETYGEYTFTAKISEDSSYTYKGDMPTASIVVYDYDSVDCSHDGECDCEVDADAVAVATYHGEDIEEYDDSEESSESSSENFSNSISLMSLDEDIMTMADVPNVDTATDEEMRAYYTDNSYTDLFGVEGSTEEIIMANLISEYVTTSIATSDNADNTSLGVSGDWIDYLNTMWYNIVGGITDSGTEDTDSVWTSNVKWKESLADGLVTSVWLGTGQDDSNLVFDTTTTDARYDSTTKTWTVWVGEQLLYALENYTEGDTIEIEANIDLNGQYYCWPDIELKDSLTIDGNDHTIYNLGSFIDYGDTEYDSTRSGFISFSAGWGESPVYVIEDLNFDTGKIYADTDDSSYSSVNLSLFGIESSAVSVEFDDIHIENYLVCSNSAAVSVFVSVGLAADWNSTTEYTTGYDVSVDSGSAFTYTSDGNTLIYDANFASVSYTSSLNDYIEMDDYPFKITANNCSVSDSYVYGTDHVGSMGSYTSMSFTNCYAVGNVLVGTGYHSGSFVSCLNNAGYFENCFAADNYLYSASQSGGFVGYSGDSADYVNCYSSGIVEGYSSIGGFVGTTRVGHDYIAKIKTTTVVTLNGTLYTIEETEVIYDSDDDIMSSTTTTTTTTESQTVGTSVSYSYSYISRNYSTFTNCYSTTLVGMRTETNNSGGFVGMVAYMENYNPTAAAVFDSCYAAGEVGSTQTVTETNENHLGGFVGYDQTYNNEYDEDGTYTTVYNNVYYDKQTTAMREWVSGRYESNSTTNEYSIDIMGVLTSDSDKYGTGLISEPAEEHYETTDDDGNITDIESGFIGFTNDDDWVYDTEEHYPELSVFANASSSDWANPDLVQAYSLASTATVILDTWDYGYTWDSEGIRSDSKELYLGTYSGLDDHVADRYTYDTVREVVSNASITDTAQFDEMVTGGILTQSYIYDSDYLLLYDDDKNIVGYTTAGGVDEYEDKEDLIEQGIVVATKYDGLSAFTLDNTSDSLTVDAPGIDWYEIEETVDGETGYRPIRLIAFMMVDAGEDQVLSASDLYDHKDDAYFTMVDTIKQNMIVALDYAETWSTSLMQIYPETEEFYAVDTEATNFTASDSAWINTEIWRAEVVTWELSDGDFTYDETTDAYYYTDDDGAEHKFYIGQDGVIYYENDDGTLLELYASETAEDGTVTYYTADYSVNIYGMSETEELTTTQAKWNGIIPMYPDIGETQYYIVRYYWVLGNGRYRSDYKIIEIDDEEIDVSINHDVTINVYNEDATEETEATPNEYVMSVNADGYEGYTTAYPNFDDETSSTSTTATYDNYDNLIQGVAYGENSYVSWVKEDESSVVTRTVLTMTSNGGYVVGSEETTGELTVGDEITIDIETFYLEYTYDETDKETITGQTTVSEMVPVTYTVQEDENGGLYLEFADSTDETGVTFEDTSYNITFDIYVQEASKITVTKVIDNFDESVDDGMDEQSFVINLTGDVTTDVVLTHDETSNPIYVVLDSDETCTFYVDETVPMEFELVTITYKINDGEEQTYSSTTGIEMGYDDEVEIIVTNTFDEESYFKARDEVNNEFTYETD